MASASILCDSAGAVAWEAAQLLHSSSSPSFNPNLPSQALWQQGAAHHINALLPWTKANEHL